ncbi:hypothetical protein BJ944DRAFT_252357 [Cunninghamella echinulata]|nr:hypothetical protein BJ944DRAFT_252357 [Cunninghamella echinulata]
MMNKPIKPLIFIDFDETITTVDTIALLGQFGINHQLNNNSNNENTIPKSWSYFTNTYLEDYQQVKKEQSSFNNDNENNKEISRKTKRNTTLVSFIKEHSDTIEPFRKVEQQSLDRIASFEVLKGLTSKEWQQAGAHHAPLRPYSDTLFKNENVLDRLYIVSLNWSKDWILGALYRNQSDSSSSINMLKKSHILSNDLEFDSTHHLSTGKIIPSILLTSDKLINIQSILQKKQKQLNQNTKIPWIYIGDSMGDLLPLLECDKGIIIGRNEKLLETLKHMDIPIQENLNTITTDKKKIVYRVDDWEQILNSNLLE